MKQSRKEFLKNILMGTGSLFLWTSCNDAFLNRKPLDQISSDSFWNKEDDLKVYNNSLYDMARHDDNVPIMMGHDEGFGSHNVSLWYIDQFSDNMAPTHPRQTFYNQIRSGANYIPDSPGGQMYGYRGWDFVRSINYGLEQTAKADIGQAVKDKYAAEARLFRGWFYADKVSKFGDVQWVDKPLNIDSEALNEARTPRDEVMGHVLDDLKFATQNLPNDWGDGNAPGRLNRWCALAIKSRVCLFEGTWQKYHGGSNSEMWLQEAASAAKEVIDNGPYSLYSTGDPQNDYNAYMRIIDLSGNPEVMYWRKYKTGVVNNWIQSYFTGYSGGVTKSLVDDYLCTDGQPISKSGLYQGDEQIEDVFKNRDPRLRQTVLHPDDSGKYNYNADGRDYPRFPGMTGVNSTTGYHIIKYYNADDYIGHAYNTSESPAITIRFGEVLLNYAEAMAELGTITQSDLDMSINKLRDRVGMPHLNMGNVPQDPNHANDGVPPLIVEIRRERRVELAIEGFRYFDLLRWKQGHKLAEQIMGLRWNSAAEARYQGAQVDTVKDPDSGKTYIDPYAGLDWDNAKFDENKNYFWPIPLSVMSRNSNIKQNPGWG